MKLVWCPETASRAYVDAVRALAGRGLDDANVGELLGAMAGGWKAQLIVEAWSSRDDSPATGMGLQAAARHTRGRHVCVVPDGESAAEYVELMRRAAAAGVAEEDSVVAGEAEEVMRVLEGVDFMVVDWRRGDAGSVLREARPGPRGMVVVCKNTGRRHGGGTAAASEAVVTAAGRRVVRSALLPIGMGVEVLHVGVGNGPRLGGEPSRWISHVDRETGEEHVFRR